MTALEHLSTTSGFDLVFGTSRGHAISPAHQYRLDLEVVMLGDSVHPDLLQLHKELEQEIKDGNYHRILRLINTRRLASNQRGVEYGLYGLLSGALLSNRDDQVAAGILQVVQKACSLPQSWSKQALAVIHIKASSSNSLYVSDIINIRDITEADLRQLSQPITVERMLADGFDGEHSQLVNYIGESLLRGSHDMLAIIRKKKHVTLPEDEARAWLEVAEKLVRSSLQKAKEQTPKLTRRQAEDWTVYVMKKHCRQDEVRRKEKDARLASLNWSTDARLRMKSEQYK